jgi:tripartite-type tricarboxylate transporter receptor subunit TctC
VLRGCVLPFYGHPPDDRSEDAGMRSIVSQKLHMVASVAAAVLAVLGAVSAGNAQTDFPNRRITVILPYPAGGIVDIVTRVVTEKLSADWHQPIIIEPKPGANGNLAWNQVSQADPDGYTWTFVSPALVANPRMQPSIKWSELSFVPIGGVVWAPSVLVVNSALPVKTVSEFIAHAKQNPGVLNWANPGTGTSQHLNTAIFINATKVEMVAVSYRGQPAGILDLLANRVHFMIASPGLVAEHIESRTLKPLAILGTKRSPLLPDVPTVAEAGYPEINVVAWYGYAAPRGTPQPVVDKIVAGFNAALKDAGVRAALEKQYLQMMDPLGPAELAALVASDAEKYAKVIRDANIRLAD